MTRNAYILIAILVAIALLLAVILFPTKSQVALMLYEDRHFNESYAYYKKFYESGDHSYQVVKPLVNLYLEHADQGSAIALLEQYVKENPKNIEIREYLSGLYLDNNLPYKYAKNLQELYKLDPSKKILRAEYQYYNETYDEFEKEIPILQTIEDRYALSEQEAVTLSNLYASTNERTLAVKTMDALFKGNDTAKFSLPTIVYAFELYTQNGQAEKASELALRYAKSHQDINTAVTLASLMSRFKMNQEGLKLLSTLPPQEQEDSRIFQMQIGLLIVEGKDEAIYSLLKNKFDKSELPPNLMDDLIRLSLTYQDYPYLKKIIDTAPLEQLPESIIVWIVQTGIINHQYELVDLVHARLGDDYLIKHPFLTLVLNLGEAPANGDEEKYLHGLPDTKKLSNPQHLILAQLFFLKGYKTLARKQLLEIDSWAPFNEKDFYSLASLYLQTGLSEKGLGKIEELRSKEGTKSEDKDTAWALLATAQGMNAEVEAWLSLHPGINESIMTDLFYVAADRKNKSLALFVAELLNKRDPSKKNRLLLANAYLVDGQERKVLEIVEPLLDQGKEYKALYFQALVVEAKTDLLYRRKLKDMILEELEDPAMTDLRKRGLGYLLFENEYKKEAADIFTDLALGRPYDAPDVQSLLAIWGEYPPMEGIIWIQEHAARNQGAEKLKWLNRLIGVHAADRVIDTVRLNDLHDDGIADLYLQALDAKKQQAKIGEVITQILRWEKRAPRLKKLAQIARDERQQEVAERAYLLAHAMDPTDGEILRELGLLYFAKGALTPSKFYFQAYFDLQSEGDYLSNFEYAEILKAQRFYMQANGFYQRSLYQVDSLESARPENQRLQAQLYFRLGMNSQALNLFSMLFEDDPTNLSLRIEYANLLITLEKYKCAKAILFGCEVDALIDRALETNKEKEPTDVIYLMLTRVRLYKSINQIDNAMTLAYQLRCLYPQSVAVLNAIADLQNTIGYWPEALAYIMDAEALEPENENLSNFEKAIFKPHRPIRLIGGEYRVTGLFQKERFGHVMLEHYIAPFNLVTFYGEFDNLILQDYINAKGDPSCFDGYRERGYLTFTKFYETGITVRASLFFGNHVLGLGTDFTIADNYGFWNWSAEYHRPNWDYVQTTIEYGNVDKGVFGRTQRIGNNFVISLRGIGLLFHMKNLYDAATAYSLEGAAVYTLSQQNPFIRALGPETGIALNYALYGLYPQFIKKKIDADGIPFEPLPLLPTEQHYLFYKVIKKTCPYWQLEGHFGCMYDRIQQGKIQYIYGGSAVITDYDEYLEARFDYIHTSSSTGNGQIVDRYILNVKYTF